MSLTNFAALSPIEKINWARETWHAARDQMFLKNFTGKGENNVVQRVTELKETEKGTKCVIQLVADLAGDGVKGDNEREGNEEAMQADQQVIECDLLTHSVGNTGQLADQRSTINAREHSRDKLAHWLGDRCDQLSFLTMSGISYAFNCDGSPRINSVFPSLDFAPLVTAPSPKRSLMWTGSSMDISNTGLITNAFAPKYEMIVDAVAYAKEHGIKPLMAGGKPYYVMFVAPGTLAALKKDPAYREAVVAVATKDGQNSPWFTGATVTVDGAVIHEFNKVFNTKGAAAGSKWGSGGNVNGTRTLLCGAQALAMGDIKPGTWAEKLFQYDSRWGVNLSKIFGLLKPQFYSTYDKSVEDFGLLAIDHYIQ